MAAGRLRHSTKHFRAVLFHCCARGKQLSQLCATASTASRSGLLSLLVTFLDDSGLRAAGGRLRAMDRQLQNSSDASDGGFRLRFGDSELGDNVFD